jgi:predicted CXXCH cytochrome family protein
MLMFFVLSVSAAASAGVKDSLHNLSASGPGLIKSGVADRICEFCHISHSARQEGALWARRKSAAVYIPYSSSTAIAQPGQPTGTSILCLSCHDGTIALGEVLSRGRRHSIAEGLGRMPVGKALQGTDLSDDHPISFEYSPSLVSQNDQLVLPSLIDSRLRLDGNGELQCTTCHDPHDSPFEKLLVMPNIRSQLCIECHNLLGWEQSLHSQSAAEWNRKPPDPWKDREYETVSDNGCENCHRSHEAQGGERLLAFLNEEENCASCHNGNVARMDVMGTFKLVSIHPIEESTLIHDPSEPAIIDERHVECSDCHNPHASQATRATGGVPANVRGVNLAGIEVSEAVAEYEICLRCHGDSPNQPIARTPRQHDQMNMRLKIQTDNPSFHPVADRGKNDDVPSLIEPLNEDAVIGCRGCHNSSEATSIGGTGPEGPHGSFYSPLLSHNYQTLDGTLESEDAYALCYSCHSRDSILSDESFVEHRRHVVDESTPCNACHDPHGISATQGNEMNNSHLINFDTSIVSPNNLGQLQFVDSGDRAGSCDLLCHNESHENTQYMR